MKLYILLHFLHKTREASFVLTSLVDARKETSDGDGHEDVPKGMNDVVILLCRLSEAGDAADATDGARQNVQDGIMPTRETTLAADASDGGWRSRG